jgi:hypothetical protein
MSIRRITVSFPEGVAAKIKRAAGPVSVSAWVAGVIQDRLDDEELERRWQNFYRSVRPRRADTRRAEAIFRRLTTAPRRKKAA